MKTFIIGAVLGGLVAAGALYSVPAVDQYREVSIVSVAPNGGNHETFAINIPDDRVMMGAPGADVPAGLLWPDDQQLADFRTEVFKIRNTRDAVIGVAARNVITEGDSNVTQWVIHLPARGTVFIDMDRAPGDGSKRLGDFVAGSREFDELAGGIAERWIPSPDSEQSSPAGRIELLATYVSTTLAADAPISETTQ